MFRLLLCRKINALKQVQKVRKKMKVINLLNMKGGAAKTFSVVNMAYELWRRGCKVLLWDNDKQGNLSRAYKRYDAESIAPVSKILEEEWTVCPNCGERINETKESEKGTKMTVQNVNSGKDKKKGSFKKKIFGLIAIIIKIYQRAASHIEDGNQ